MKVFFTAHGWRETKEWSCPNCNNFRVSGMDLFVDESVKEHSKKCFPWPKAHESIKKYAEYLSQKAAQEVVIEGKNTVLGSYYLGQQHILEHLLTVWRNV